MNDEAATHYSGIIDNMSFGFKTLLDIFGKNDSHFAFLQHPKMTAQQNYLFSPFSF
jgi:hypothetical protein